MFGAVDLERDFRVELGQNTAKKASHLTSSTHLNSPSSRGPSEAALTVLQAGFRSRVMSWKTAHEVGARNGLSLKALREQTDQCAALIDAGLPCAVDESLFAALVFQYPDISKELYRAQR